MQDNRGNKYSQIIYMCRFTVVRGDIVQILTFNEGDAMIYQPKEDGVLWPR